MTASPARVARVSVLEPPGRRTRLGLAEAWQARELAGFLTWRDVKVRYKQTLLGGAWAVIQPLATAVVFSLVFGRLAEVPSDGAPYPIFALAALTPWTFIANALGNGSNSLVNNLSMITKVYVPRLLLPLSACLAAVVDLLVATVVMFVVAAFYGYYPSPRVLVLPLLMALALAAALAGSLLLSAVNLQFRDVRYVLPFATQLLLFVSPVAYSSRLLADGHRLLYALNPAVGVIDGFRWVVLGEHDRLLPWVFVVSSGSTLVLFALGLRYFRRREHAFADHA